MTQQFYPITLEDARALYERGLLSTSGFLYLFLKIRLAPGWKMTLHQREISQQLGISKSQFYRAIHKLSDEGLIDWEAPNGLVVTVKVSSVNQNSVLANETEFCQSELSYANQNSVTLSETPVTLSETPVTLSETPVTFSETNTPLKPLSVKGYSAPPDYYQIFIKSLSDNAREKFLNFVREKVKSFNPPINDLEAWLAGKNQAGKERSRVYYEMFQGEVGEGVAASQDWESHPLWQEALAAMRIGVPRFIVLGQPGCEQIDLATRRAMADYAQANHLIWGVKL